MKKLAISSILVTMAGASSFAQAQTPERSPIEPGEIYRSIDPSQLLNRGELHKPDKPILEPRIPMLPEEQQDSGASIYVKSFKFSHNTVFTDEQLLAQINNFADQELTLNKMNEIATILTRYYREEGYFVARAYLPEQQLVEDILEIAIIEGRHGEFKIDNTSLVDDKTLLGFLNVIKAGDLVRTDGLERQLLLINDLGGAKVSSSDVMPGAEVGTSDFMVGVDKTSKYPAYLMLDNYGSFYTGEHRLSAGFTINSLSGIGDTLSFSGMVSDTANLTNFGLNYGRHLGYKGWRGSVGVSKSDYEMDKVGGMNILGTSIGVNASASYPFIKSHSKTRQITISSRYQMMEDDHFDNTEEKTNLGFGLSLLERQPTYFFNRTGSFVANLGYNFGDLKMANDLAKFGDLNETAGFYHKLNFYLGHQQFVVRNLTLQTSLNAQFNLGSNNLDGGEKISVGGSNGVRAYEDSEQSGDSGYALSLDLIYSLPSFGNYHHNTSLFVDHAWVEINTDQKIDFQSNERQLNAFGVGYSANYKNLDLKATYGVGFGSEKTPSFKYQDATYSTDAAKFMFQLVYRFN